MERRLRARGWTLRARRLRTRHGECDLVLDDGRALVVVEVKSGRAGPRFTPGMRLGRTDLARRWRAAHALARGRAARVDLVEVCVEGRPPRVRVVHHPGLRTPLPAPPRGPGGAGLVREGISLPASGREGSSPRPHQDPPAVR